MQRGGFALSQIRGRVLAMLLVGVESRQHSSGILVAVYVEGVSMPEDCAYMECVKAIRIIPAMYMGVYEKQPHPILI